MPIFAHTCYISYVRVIVHSYINILNKPECFSERLGDGVGVCKSNLVKCLSPGIATLALL